jgi:hypothetical protein
MENIKDLLLFILGRKKYWLLPVILILVIIGVFVVFASSSAIAPFIYTLF